MLVVGVRPPSLPEEIGADRHGDDEHHVEAIQRADDVPAHLQGVTDEREVHVDQYGEEVYRMTPVRDFIKAGMKPVMESDINGMYSSPLWNMQALITRTDEKGKVWNANQKITRQEALWMNY